MFLINGDLYWSASDLTDAATCEFQMLRRLDYLTGRALEPKRAPDPFLDRIAHLGEAHERQVLENYQAAGPVTRIPRPASPFTVLHLEQATAETVRALTEAAPVSQAPLFDGEFLGFADFLEPTADGWVVADAKIARSAKTSALLQLGAYAAQLQHLQVPLAPVVALHLGDGTRAEHRLADVLPVFRARRARLRQLLHQHRNTSAPAAWGDDFASACGKCAECTEAIAAHQDLFLVAGLRADQRRKLHAAGITTLSQLAGASTPPPDLPEATFHSLRQQAELQWEQANSPTGQVIYRLTEDAPATFARLPQPSPGDLFFDFEGDPLHRGANPDQFGLEYLWGILQVDGYFEPLWADDEAEEKAALEAFMDRVARQRQEHPDMHVYHYAPYEVSALKRLTARYQTREAELDDLLRGGVFVDLYATVRGALRVGQDSYSIKKLEPLYMGAVERSHEEDAVTDGAGSVVAYHQYRDLLETDPEQAQKFREEIITYNQYDCVSTQRLRDWLLTRAAELGAEVGTAVRQPGPSTGPDATNPAGDEAAALQAKLLALVGSSPGRTSNSHTLCWLRRWAIFGARTCSTGGSIMRGWKPLTKNGRTRGMFSL